MATGNYGIVRPANVQTSQMEIFYTFSPSRDVAPNISMQTLSPSQVIKNFNHPVPNSTGVPLFDGLYNLELPLDRFSAQGIYTIIIKPKEIRTTITDCGVLAAFPDIKGIILDSSTLGVQDPSELIGYRVEYYDTTGKKIPNFYRIITSANKAEPITTNLNNSSQKAIKYRFNESSNLIFCTLTPSSAPNVKPNQFPNIGSPNQLISVSNTYFNPILIELDMVEYDIETLAYALYGNQSKSIADGKYTIYDFQNNIFKQYDLYEVQDQFSGDPLYEVRQMADQVDLNKEFNTVTRVRREEGDGLE